MKLLIFITLACFIGSSKCFFANSVVEKILYRFEGRFKGGFGKVSESFTHDELIKEGVIQAVVKYLYDQNRPGSKVNLTKINDYYDVRNLYYDYYGKGLCNDKIPFYSALTSLQADVTWPDLSPATGDLPYAHFDAELFEDSNNRVIEFYRQIDYSMTYNDFDDARQKSGRIIHTVQDFYSHSNWVEQGQTNILDTIGQPNVFPRSATSIDEREPCVDSISNRCILIEDECSFWTNAFITVLNALGLVGDIVTCPLKYYNCTNNINTAKLTSGYYSGQKKNDGTPVLKPLENFSKCSHGGVLDGTRSIKAEGGINKDSGYLLFSPHAISHLKAAELAIKHTRKFFEDLRIKHGDNKFDKLLKLTVDNATLNSLGDIPCSSQIIKTNKFIISFISFNFLVVFLFR